MLHNSKRDFCSTNMSGSHLWVAEVIGALGERHLLQTLLLYAAYHNQALCHLSLDRNAPKPRPIENGCGEVVATARVGGLHHRYGHAARVARIIQDQSIRTSSSASILYARSHRIWHRGHSPGSGRLPIVAYEALGEITPQQSRCTDPFVYCDCP